MWYVWVDGLDTLAGIESPEGRSLSRTPREVGFDEQQVRKSVRLRFGSNLGDETLKKITSKDN